VLNGELNADVRLKPYLEDALVIGCDGGTRHLLARGLLPDVVIGDFDSIGDVSLPESVVQVRYPADKDKLDSELAIEYAIKQGCTQIILLAFTGDHFDHMLGNINLLSDPAFSGVDLRILDNNQEIYVIKGKATITGKVGDIISFIPLSARARATSSPGLRYNLTDYVLSQHGNQGISNELLSETVKVHVTHGKILVVHHR
jgi:thiamine pyrophosphokinase